MTRMFAVTGIALLLAGVPATSAFAQAKPHERHEPQKPAPAPAPPPADAGHDHGANAAAPGEKQDLPPFIPPVTDEDRKAAFPDLDGHAVHGNAIHSYVLFDQLEWQAAGGDDDGFSVDSRGWIGRDRDRLWFRVEGDGSGGRVDEAHAHVFYGRQISRWWDLVAGVRQDVRPGDPQTWAAIGVQGLAPYLFEIEATAYVGASGRTQARFEIEYELLLTNRLVLQPLVELEIVGKSDPERGIGAGLSSTDAGFRLRYEWRREFAPYVGVTWPRKWGKTADYAEASGEDHDGARLVTGLRLWF